MARRKKGTLEKLLDKQQKDELKAARAEEKRKKKLEKLRKQAEMARAEKKLKSAKRGRKSKGLLHLPKKKKQGKALKRNRPIRLL